MLSILPLFFFKKPKNILIEKSTKCAYRKEFKHKNKGIILDVLTKKEICQITDYLKSLGC
jgi:hypothetical protein